MEFRTTGSLWPARPQGSLTSVKPPWAWLAASVLFVAGCQREPARTPSALAETDFATARARMIEEQLMARPRTFTNEQILAVVRRVPRHEFVPPTERAAAYEDHPLPIGHGQTISQPSLVALMTQTLEPKSTDRILEVGTGSGYQAAILAGLVAEVYSVEIIEPLARRAAETLGRLGYTNIHLRVGDGYRGWPEAAPFDAIIVTCAPDHVPEPLTAQLREGGRLVIPVGPEGDQTLYLFRKRGDQLERQAVLPVRFVPMTGEAEQP